MAESTIDTVAIEFEGNAEKLGASVNTLIKILENLKTVTSGSTSNLNKLSNSIKNITNNSNKLNNTNSVLKNTSNNLLSIVKTHIGLGTVAKKISDMVKSSAELISTQARFDSVFGSSNEELQNAKDFVEKYTNALYADKNVVEGAMATFKQLTANMGVSNDASYKMSKNLTQLGYDLAATGIAGTNVSEAFTALRSGIGGEAEALKRYGIQLNQTTLQETLYANGINKKVSELNSAQKAELYYYQIMKSTTAQQGYAAQALQQPANALQVVKNQFITLGRAIGNLFIPILMAAIPYVIVITQLLQRAAQAIAAFFKINLDFSGSKKITSGLGNISSGIGDIGSSADKTKKKVQNMLRDFDELHVVNFDTDSTSGSGSGSGAAGGGGLGLPIKEYDALSNLTSEFSDKIERAKENLKSLLPIIIAIGAAFAIWKIANLVKDFDNLFKALKNLDPVTQLIAGFTLLAAGAFAVYNGLDSIMDGEINLKSVTQVLLGTLAIFIASLIVIKALGKLNLIGDLGFKKLLVVAATASVIIVSIIAFVVAMKKAFEDTSGATKYLTVAVAALAIAMGVATIAGAPLLAAILGIVGGLVILKKLFQELATYLKKIFGKGGEITDRTEETSESFTNFKDTITETTNKGLTSFKNFGDGIKNILGQTDSTASDTSENMDKYLNTDLLTSLNNSSGNFSNFKDNLNGILGESATNVYTNVQNMQGSLGKLDNSISNSTTAANDLNKVNLDEINNNVEQRTSAMSGEFKKLQEGSDKTKKSLEGIGKAEIKTPHFSWKDTVQSGLSTALKSLLSSFGMATALPVLNIKWYEKGGFPKRGDLFVANENGPEMISKMGNRSVVANNQQITTGIAAGVYDGVYDAMSNFGNNGDTYVYVGTKQITDVITKKQKSNNDKYGR